MAAIAFLHRRAQETRSTKLLKDFIVFAQVATGAVPWNMSL
jgi:hypothetical protein